MSKSKLYRVLLLTLLLSVFLIVGQAASAQGGATVFAVTTNNTLLRFDTNAPGTITSANPITGLQSGESILGIDFRPATQQLFAVGSSSRIYIIDPMTGAASAAGSAFSPALNGTEFGFDFNPTVDRIRLVSDAEQNLRLNPNNGAVAATDGTLVYAAADANAGANPNGTASAYTNNANGVTTTVLYNIDSNLDILVRQAPPNDGVLNTVGTLGVNASGPIGFDILANNAAFASINSNLYTINLTTGAAANVGAIGTSETIRDIALAVSMIGMAPGSACSDVGGATNAVVRFSPGANAVSSGSIFCRVLVENTVFVNPAAEVGMQALVNQGIVQAVDVFALGNDGSPITRFNSPVQVCLLGAGRFFFLDATTSPRAVSQLESSFDGAYSCAYLGNAGTVALLR